MHFISTSSSDGVTEQHFTLGEVPGILWMPDGGFGTLPLILLGHGGGQHKAAPGVVARARHYASEGFAVVAIDAPHHGERPRDEEFDRVLAGLRADMESSPYKYRRKDAKPVRLPWAAWRTPVWSGSCYQQVGPWTRSLRPASARTA
ncbi:alpha/beta hydrolase family protein [Streptomyces echinatus]|uniref:alpha/beta hydrolase family protein n=1 Tax=Streptomyces echinatus TaxID=67293 RepID=UPI0037B1F8BB